MSPNTSSVPVAIRLATANDWPALGEIIAAVVRTGYTYTLDPGVSEAEAKEFGPLRHAPLPLGKPPGA